MTKCQARPILSPMTDNVTPQPARDSGPLAAAGYVFMAALLLTVPWMEFMTEGLHQRATHFELSVYFDYLLVLIAATAVTWPVWLLARGTMGKRFPRAWLVFVGLIVGGIVGTVATYRAGMSLGQLLDQSLFVWAYRNTWVFSAGTALLVAAIPAVRIKVLAVSRVAAKLLAPLPLVMLVFFASQPAHETRRDALPQPPAASATPAPVIILVCDALDRETVFGEGLHELPFLQRCRHEFTWFEQSRTPAFHTSEAMPSILYQRDDITRADYEALTERNEDLWSDQLTIFDMLGRDGDVRVVSGYHVLYGRVLEGRDITVRTRALAYPKHLSLPVRMFACLNQTAFLEYIPLVSNVLDPTADWENYSDLVAQEIMDDATTCVQEYGPDLFAVFHLAWPHPPFIYDREGRTPEKGSYQANCRYLDTRLSQFADLLKERGLWDACTLVITGDHGFPFSGKRHPPMLVKLPGQAGGRTVSEVTKTSELARWLHGQPEFTALRPPN